MIKNTLNLIIILFISIGFIASASDKPDFTKEKTIYVVPYAHLDTQWRWTYITTIDSWIKNTINTNLKLFEKHPDYIFTFTGSSRFEMMKEYYPEEFEKVRALIREGRWRVGGSSVDENDGIVPSPESMLRQILYGNRWFQHEFGRESVDYMLPDCFGFPHYLPSIFAHAGLKGFNTQKLSWGYPYKIPFPVGYWEGPDGNGIISALNATPYGSGVVPRMDKEEKWLKRINEVGDKSGYYCDFRYFGTGDKGGSPQEKHIINCLASKGEDGLFNVKMTGSDQLFRDLPEDAKEKMAKYKGELLLKEHSAGSITSQAYMKRWNRKNELLADSAERAATQATWLGAMEYPKSRLNEAWVRVLASQMHDILPGTSLPPCYDLSWNDEIVALNQFAEVLKEGARDVIKGLDTRTEGQPLVVYNPLSRARNELVEATISFPGNVPSSLYAVAPDGSKTPVQILESKGHTAKIVFAAKVESLSWTVYGIREGKLPERTKLAITKKTLENDFYQVTINADGDVSSIIDKQNDKREMLSGPAQIHFQYHKPKQFPAWNMDWEHQKQPPQEVLKGPATINIIENGPVRVALEIIRKGRNSVFTQQVRLSTGEDGKRVEFKTHIDWQGRECAVKAAFPLTVSNKNATYNMGMGKMERPTNHEKLYEMPHREWLDLTDSSGEYGISILEDCKFASDKPTDNTLRLTLLYTPAIAGSMYADQHSQDWGRHDMTYALYGHKGDWRNGSDAQGRSLNQPLRAFTTNSHKGSLGKSFSFLGVSTDQVDVRALKKAEDSDAMILRLQELTGKPVGPMHISFAAPIAEAWEVNGQERKIGPAKFKGNKLFLDMGTYGIHSFAVRLQKTNAKLSAVQSQPVPLNYNVDVFSHDKKRADGDMDGSGRTMPAEILPKSLKWKGVNFTLGSTESGAKNAVACTGQSIQFPKGDFDKVMLLVAANERLETEFSLGNQKVMRTIPAWTGFIGQYDNRLWDREFKSYDFHGLGKVTDLAPGYIHREPIAWFSHHRHSQKRNEAYRFSYIFACELVLPKGATSLTLPKNDRIKIFALSMARTGDVGTSPAQSLYDDFADWKPLVHRPQVYANILTDGMIAKGMASVDRQAKWEDLSMGPPASDDAASAAKGVSVNVFYGERDFRKRPMWWCLNKEKTLPALNNGVGAQKDGDRKESIEFPAVGYFGVTLPKSTNIARVNTYSRWRNNDMPATTRQLFTLWGSNAEEMPKQDFTKGVDSGWELIAAVDSRGESNGGKHGSSVMDKDGETLGPYRHLIWVVEAKGYPTLFTEIDVIEAQ
ncbi:MAG: alpha-mannosidase [Planctomycetes bacterium]|nr:alpha-mannosidase [Planctomycetota bacterium]